MGAARRDGDHESRAFVDAAVDGNRPAMQPNELVGQRQPDAGPFVGARLLPLDAVKAFEHTRQLVRGNARARVLNRQLHGAVAAAEIDANHAVERELERV